MIDTYKDQNVRITDPRLPILVSQAALELDRAAKGETVSLERAKEFFAFLSQSLYVDAGNAERRWLDPETVDVFGNALLNSGRVPELRTVQDVVREALHLVKAIPAKTQSGAELDLNELRSFCVAFGNSLLAHRAQYIPQPPANPYRK